MALRVRLQDGIKTIGAAFADATNRDLGVAEFAENDLFTNTEVRTTICFFFIFPYSSI